jgi:cell division transport system permease protein
MFILAYRVVKFALQNFWRNIWLSLITVSMLVLTLLSVNVLIMLNAVGQKAIAYVEDRVEVSVYFNADVTDEKVADAAGYLQGLSQVRNVGIITADEALDKFKTRHAADTAILQSLDEIDGNPFGPTLVIKAQDVDAYPFILDALDNPQFRDDIREKDFTSYEEIISRIESTTERIRLFGLGLSLTFLLIAILIVFNTVRIAIFIHREEIGIMKLVGASNGFVRAPFLLESIIYGALATGIVAALMYPTVAFLEPKFDLYFDGQSTGLVSYFVENGWIIFGGQFLVLSLINVLSTMVAMRKYLKV